MNSYWTKTCIVYLCRTYVFFLLIGVQFSYNSKSNVKPVNYFMWFLNLNFFEIVIKYNEFKPYYDLIGIINSIVFIIFLEK